MRDTNLVKKYWDYFDRICEVSKKYAKRLIDDGILMSSLAKQRQELIKELFEAGEELKLGGLSEKEITLFLCDIFDKKMRREYRKVAKRYKRLPISMVELRAEVFARREESKKRQRGQEQEISREVRRKIKRAKKAARRSQEKETPAA